MSEQVYSREFWEAALRLVDQPQKCEQCKLFHNEKTRPRILVRVVLTGDGTPRPHMLRLLCRACYPDPKQRGVSRKQLLAKIAELPFPEPDKAKTVNAR